MLIGVALMPIDPWPHTAARAQRLEQLGYHQIWTYDHLSWQRFQDKPWHATMPWLTGLAASTQRIRFGTMVSNLNLRHPLVLAKDAMTLDHVSNGRVTIGVGAAGVGFDATALGQTPLTPRQRIDRLEEFVPLFDGLLSDTIRNHTGEYYTVSEARLLPGCVQHPRVPIAIAAGGPRGLRLTAETADAWITHGANDGVRRSAVENEAIVLDQVRELNARCDDIGRDPVSLDRVYLSGHDAGEPLASIDAFDDLVGRMGELGFTQVVFHHPIPGDDQWDAPLGIVDEIADRHLTPS